MVSFFPFFFHLFWCYVMVIGVVAATLDGKKTPPTKASTKVKVTIEKKKKPRKKRINPFVDNVEFSDVTGKNYSFGEDWFITKSLKINTGIPSQGQRKVHFVNGGRRVNFYDPTSFEKKCLRAEVKKQLPADYEKFSGPVLVKVTFYFPIPTYNPTCIKKYDYYTKTPDIDNLQKFLFDSLDCLYLDDSLLVSVTAAKMYGDSEYVEILIAEERGKKVTVVKDDSEDDEDSEDA